MPAGDGRGRRAGPARAGHRRAPPGLARAPPVVVELAVDPDALRAAPRSDGPVHDLSPAFEFDRGAAPLPGVGQQLRRPGRRAGLVARPQGGPPPRPATGSPRAARPTSSWPTARRSTSTAALPTRRPLASGVGVVHRWSAEAGRLVPAAHRAAAAPSWPPTSWPRWPTPSGPARVIAPAGSGKTRVLTERLRHLVADRGADPGTVSALAYNTRAADEMQAAVRRASSRRTGPTSAPSTAPGCGSAPSSGPPGRPRVLEELEVRDLLQGLFDIRRQANADTVAPYIAALSAIRLGLSPPAAVEEAIPDAAGHRRGVRPVPVRARPTWARSTSTSRSTGPSRSCSPTPTPGRAAQARCRRLLVDEFQDLTPAHLLLIRLLAAPGYDCFGVGDDDQVIYGYSGATPEFLIDFPRYFPGAGHHPLEVNYRCPPAVVGAARHLLSYNRRRIEKTIRSPEGRTDADPAASGPLAGAGPVAVRTAPGDELAALAAEIITRLAGVGRRARRHRRPGPGQLGAAARPGGLRGGRHPLQPRPLGARVLGRTGIRTAFAYLRIGTDPGPHPEGGHPRHHPTAVPGHRPDGGGHADQGPVHLGRRHPPAGRPAVRPGRPQAAGLRRRSRHGGRGRRPFHRRRPAGHRGRHRPRRHHGRARLVARGRRTAPPTPTTWSPWRRWPPSTPRRPRSSRGCAGSWPARRPRARACCCPRCTGSRARSGTR